MVVFSLLRLPLINQLEILGNLDVRELIKLSTCSRKAYQLVQLTNPSLKHPMTVNLFTNTLNIDLYLKDSYSIQIGPYTLSEGYGKGPKFVGFGGLKMFEYLESVWEHRKSWACVIEPKDGQDFYEIVDCVFGYLMKLFKKVDSVNCRLSPIDIHVKLIQKNFPKIDDLKICPLDRVRRSGEDRVITKKEAKFALESLNSANVLTVEIEVEKEFEHTLGFPQKSYIRVDDAFWVHINCIIDSECHTMFLVGCNIPSKEDLNRFVKSWMSLEKMKTMKFLTWCLGFNDDAKFPQGYLEEALEGIEHGLPDLEKWRSLSAGELPFSREIRRVDNMLGVVQVNDNLLSFLRIDLE